MGSSAMYEILFRDVTLVDGTGAEPIVTSVAVNGERIAAIGDHLSDALEEIEGRGLVLMPGVIDGHTHYDAQLTWDSYADPSIELGVTTVVIGNCGFTIAPCKPEDHDLTMRNLTQVEGMDLEALRAGLDWSFESFPDYLNMLERRGVGPNVAAFLGHSALRTYVMGPDASRREATESEISQMAAILADAMDEGALGFSTSTNESHNGEGGIPMPSRLAETREMRAFADVLASADTGVFMITRGQKTPIPELAEMASDSGRPFIVAPFNHSNNSPEVVFNDLAQIEKAQAKGARIHALVSCLPVTFDFTLNSAYVFEGLDSWHPAMAAKGDALRATYADPAFRTSVQEELDRTRGKRLFNSEWDKVHLCEAVLDKNKPLEGRSLADLADAAGTSPLAWMLDFALSEDLGTLFTAQLRNTDETAVAKLINRDDALITLSDAGAHLSFMCDAGYALHLLGYWVRERKTMTLAKAVHKLTQHPAQLFGITDRGTVAEGAYADLFLFDPDTVARGSNERLHDLPSGAQRQRATGVGVKGVWINGQRMVNAAGKLDARSCNGRILRSFNS